MKIISIDVGIKNLSFCLFENMNNNFIIKKWNIINLMEYYLFIYDLLFIVLIPIIIIMAFSLN